MSESEDRNALFERLLEKSGGFGRFQKLFLALCIYSGIVAASNHLSAIYLTFSPAFSCAFREQINNASARFETDDEKLQLSTFESSCDSECSQLVFDQSAMHRSLVTAHQLVCDRKVLLPIVTGSYMFGVVSFSLATGTLSDKYGRKTMFIILTSLHLIASVMAAFTFENFWLFLLSRFLVGGSVHNIWVVLFIISMETTLADKRAFVSGLINSAWNLGGIVLALIAFFLRDAWHMQILFALLALSILLLLPLVPESPRWLVQHQRTEKARRVYQTMASYNRINVVNISPTLDALVDLDSNKSKSEGAILLNRYNARSSMISRIPEFLCYSRFREVRHRLLLLLPAFLAVGTSSYGIHFTTKFVEGNLFLTAMLKEAFTLTWILMLISIYRRMHRTTCLLLMYALSGISALLFFVLSTDVARTLPSSMQMLVFGFTQALMTGNYYLVDTYVPEVFSTDIRNFVFSLLETTSKMGTVLAPFIVDWGGSLHSGLPTLVFGSLMLSSGLVFVFTPETKGMPLKQHVEELVPDQNSIAHRILGRRNRYN